MEKTIIFWTPMTRRERRMNNTDKLIGKLISSHLTIATMESCTSGLIASTITDTEGASEIFPGGYVAYRNETKILAGVEEEIIKKYGVYSPECACAMAQTAKNNLHTDIGIGITGTTGNVDPNNADSVEGQAFFCIIIRDHIYHYEIRTAVDGMSRREIKQYYVDQVFTKLQMLLDNPEE